MIKRLGLVIALAGMLAGCTTVQTVSTGIAATNDVTAYAAAELYERCDQLQEGVEILSTIWRSERGVKATTRARLALASYCNRDSPPQNLAAAVGAVRSALAAVREGSG